MAEDKTTPSAGGSFSEKLKKIPIWVYLAGAAGVGIIYYYNSKVAPPAATTATGSINPSASGLNTANVAGVPFDYYNPPPLYGGTPNPPTPSPTPSPSQPTPGTTFLGPTGVDHYMSTGTQTLSQIAQLLGLQSWNTIYAIPENQQQFNGGHPMDAQSAANYIPPANMGVVVPTGTTFPQNSSGPSIGGSSGEGSLEDEWGSLHSNYNIDTTSLAQYLYSTPGVTK